MANLILRPPDDCSCSFMRDSLRELEGPCNPWTGARYELDLRSRFLAHYLPYVIAGNRDADLSKCTE